MSGRHLSAIRRKVRQDFTIAPSVAVFGLSLLAAGVLTVLLHTFFLDFADRLRSPDYLTFYEPIGRNIIEGRGVVTATGEAAISFPPGHPVFLAVLIGVAGALGTSPEVVFSVIALVLHAVTATLLFNMTVATWGKRWATIAALLWATYLPALWLPIAMGSEVPFVSVFMVAVSLGWRCVRSVDRPAVLAFGSGLGVGVARLIRPIAVGAALPFCLFLVVARRRRGLAGGGTLPAMLVAGNLAVVVPWELWVYRETGEVHVISSGGMISIVDGLTYARPRSEWRTLAPPCALVRWDSRTTS